MQARQNEKMAGLISKNAMSLDKREPVFSKQTQSSVAKPTLEHPTIWTRIQESWITEVAALVVSACAIAGIAGLLWKYNERQLPSWNGVSLNSLVSWLTTVAGICMGYVAATSIAQLKWVWFAQEARKMEDMRLFNAAGDVVGAIELLMRLKVRYADCRVEPCEWNTSLIQSQAFCRYHPAGHHSCHRP